MPNSIVGKRATGVPKAQFHTSPGGYKLCYQVFGDPAGFPLLYCHGFPGSRLEARLTQQAATALKVCVIAPDRPGFGGSEFQPNRQMRDWVQSVENLMDSLGHVRFSVLGVSGGGPYAMLLGECLHRRIYRIGIVCGLGNLAQPGSEKVMGMAQQHLIRFARAFPRAALLLNRNLVAAVLGRFPSAAVRVLTGKAPEADRRVLSEPETRGIFVDATREAFTQGGRGPAWELYLYTHEWQADPFAVKAKTFLWHGELDTTVPVAMARRHAEQIPDCNPIFLPGEGHFSLPVSHAEPILSALVP